LIRHRDHNGQNLAYIYFEEITRYVQSSRVLEGATTMEATVDILIISALIPDYWPLLAGLTMAVALALV
jgi:hypothetical protein